MFLDLHHALNASDQHIPFQGQFIVIQDALNADGSFLLQHFLTLFLESSKTVCFVGLEQSLFHYFNIARKLGVNLSTEYEKGRFSFINGLSQSLSRTQTNQVDAAPPPFPVTLFSFQSSLRELYNKFTETIASSKSHACIIIDNVNILFYTYPQPEVLEFLQYCRLLVQKHQASLVVLAHSDCDDFGVKTLKYKTDWIFECCGLGSGVSRDIHGIVSIFKKSLQEHQKLERTLQYKILENNVKFFPPGTRI